MPAAMKSNGAPSMIAAASLLARTSYDARKDEWPYAWDFCPPDGENWHQESAIDFPANATLTQLLSYAVPNGMKLRIKSWMLFYVGVALQDGLSLVTWQMAVNIPANVIGITTPVMPSSYAVPYLGSIVISKGSPTSGPWPLPGKLVFNARDVVSVNVTTTAPFPDAGGQFLTAWDGWQFPSEPSS